MVKPQRIVKIMYHKMNLLNNERMLNLFVLPNVKMEDIDKYYVNVCKFSVNEEDICNVSKINSYLSSLFKKFNSDQNPLSSEVAQKFIGENHTYTSMSIGSVIVLGDDYYCVSNGGFIKIIS